MLHPKSKALLKHSTGSLWVSSGYYDSLARETSYTFLHVCFSPLKYLSSAGDLSRHPAGCYIILATIWSFMIWLDHAKLDGSCRGIAGTAEGGNYTCMSVWPAAKSPLGITLTQLGRYKQPYCPGVGLMLAWPPNSDDGECRHKLPTQNTAKDKRVP